MPNSKQIGGINFTDDPTEVKQLRSIEADGASRRYFSWLHPQSAVYRVAPPPDSNGRPPELGTGEFGYWRSHGIHRQVTE